MNRRKSSGQDMAVPLIMHLKELRKTLLLCCGVIVLLSIAAYCRIDPLLRELARPVGKLYFLSPAEALITKMKFAVIVGAIISTPLTLYALWRFIQRGLFPREQQIVALLTGISCILFGAGALFCYSIVLPVSVSFLMNCGSDILVPYISVTQYLSFVSRMIISFGIAFELPLAIWFLTRAGLVRASTLQKHRRIAVVVLFLAAAVLTPTTDVFNQLVLAAPLLLLYEAGIAAARISERKRGATYGKNRIAGTDRCTDDRSCSVRRGQNT
jgi:sec-independent protein translocase protein TatC